MLTTVARYLSGEEVFVGALDLREQGKADTTATGLTIWGYGTQKHPL